MISIIMPCYNSEKYLSRSIESVLTQTRKDWELILVNDCSKDGTQAIIDSYSRKDERIIGIELKKNSKASGARNAGLDQASFRYIAFIDSDDIWLKDKLETQVSFMEKENAPFTYTAYLIMDSNEKVSGTRYAPPSVDFHRLLTLGNDIGCSTVVYDSYKFKNYRFDLSIPYHEDYKMWLDMLRSGAKAFGISKALTLYRVHLGSKNLNKWNSWVWNWKIWRECEKQSILQSVIITIRWGVYKVLQRTVLR